MPVASAKPTCVFYLASRCTADTHAAENGNRSLDRICLKCATGPERTENLHKKQASIKLSAPLKQCTSRREASTQA